jgi:hypothetical protein
MHVTNIGQLSQRFWSPLAFAHIWVARLRPNFKRVLNRLYQMTGLAASYALATALRLI